MNYILFDPPEIERFYPFTMTRPLGEMRLFGGTIKEIWESFLGCQVSYLTRDYLSELYPAVWSKSGNVLINSEYLPSNEDNQFINTSNCNISLNEVHNMWLNKQCVSGSAVRLFDKSSFFTHIKQQYVSDKNKLDCSNKPLFNDDEGPIIIEEDVIIMQGSMIKGPVHICKGSIIKMGAKIYGPTIIGPYCKIGGEVSNSIFLGFSNKSHEGFIGHSIIGEWCNIGAGTSNSNLKNDYGFVKTWDYVHEKFTNSGQQFLGLYLGDHSKCAINTSFNTGTTVGVNCNIFGSGFPRNFIPSFSWGGSQGLREYNLLKALEVAKKVMSRRNVKLTQQYADVMRFVFTMTSHFRHFN
tara:strand:+ start:244 stop:1302 length:1059 start_codon:yes stop_codon:yes gene_type:complete